MVAVSGTGWKLAPSLVALIDETDARFPDREHSSDGSIGDYEHSTRTSDHNPDDGWVCAVDIDEDLSPTLHSLRYLWDLLVDRRDHRVKYLIYEGQIIKGYVDSGGHPAWNPYPYTGANAHAHHLHVSIWNTVAARDDIGPWWDNGQTPAPPEEDDDMQPHWVKIGTDAKGAFVLPDGRVLDKLTAEEKASLQAVFVAKAANQRQVDVVQNRVNVATVAVKS